MSNIWLDPGLSLLAYGLQYLMSLSESEAFAAAIALQLKVLGSNTTEVNVSLRVCNGDRFCGLIMASGCDCPGHIVTLVQH